MTAKGCANVACNFDNLSVAYGKDVLNQRIPVVRDISISGQIFLLQNISLSAFYSNYNATEVGNDR